MMREREQVFDLYLHDIHDLPLLSLADEQRLVAQIVEGRNAQQQLVTAEMLAFEQRCRLDQIVAAGQQARDKLIAAHLRLVVRIARQYTSRGILLLDLIQEGNLGLIQAVDHFDPQYGARFATYAVWWIRHAITQAVAEAQHPVRLPDTVRAKVYLLYRARTDLLQRLGREPNEHELAQATNLPLREVCYLLHYLQPTVSLNQPLNEDEAYELADMIPDPAAEIEISTASQAVLAEELEQLLHNLNDDERRVLTLRFGLYHHPLRTRQEVAKLLDISTERVRQLEARALRKLRSSELLDQLHEYIDR